jgi:hypothetical protein
MGWLKRPQQLTLAAAELEYTLAGRNQELYVSPIVVVKEAIASEPSVSLTCEAVIQFARRLLTLSD